MRAIILAVLSVAVLAGPVEAQAGQGRDRAQGRAELEEQVRHRFMEQVSRRLELSAAQRQRMVAVLQEGAEARRELSGESREVRRELMQAVRQEEAAMATYERLLERMAAVREAERALEAREEARMAEVLDARQRAIFLMMRMQLNDRVRGMRRGGGPGGLD